MVAARMCVSLGLTMSANSPQEFAALAAAVNRESPKRRKLRADVRAKYVTMACRMMDKMLLRQVSQTRWGASPTVQYSYNNTFDTSSVELQWERAFDDLVAEIKLWLAVLQNAVFDYLLPETPTEAEEVARFFWLEARRDLHLICQFLGLDHTVVRQTLATAEKWVNESVERELAHIDALAIEKQRQHKPLDRIDRMALVMQTMQGEKHA